MGVRPPTPGSEDREVIEFGIAALTPIVEDADLEFPLGPDAVVRSLDDPTIPVDAKGRSIELSTALEEADADRFGSKRDLLNAVHPVLEAHRERVSSGLLATIRGSLPL